MTVTTPLANPVTTSSCDRTTAVTRSLLGYGVLAGPVYLAVGVVEGLSRDGFELDRHALSLLSNGSWGWIHMVNLMLAGAMTMAAAVGLHRAMPDGVGHRWAPRLVAGFGLGVFGGGVFVADPMDGFLGTPDGPPVDPTLIGTLHMIFASVGFLSLAVAMFVHARRLRRLDGRRHVARWSRAAGVVAIAGMATTTVAGVWLSVIVCWAWLAVVSIDASRRTAPPSTVMASS